MTRMDQLSAAEDGLVAEQLRQMAASANPRIRRELLARAARLERRLAAAVADVLAGRDLEASGWPADASGNPDPEYPSPTGSG